ncbi:MAG: hypothetical protein ACRC2J_01135 [Microcoleaceae cyanobacterium]
MNNTLTADQVLSQFATPPTPFGELAEVYVKESWGNDNLPSPTDLFEMIDTYRALAKNPQVLAKLKTYLDTLELNDN